MKRTLKQRIYWLCQMMCFFVVPCVLIWTQYSGAAVANAYKVSWTAIAVGGIMFMLGKRFWLDDFIVKKRAKIPTLESLALTTTEQKAVQSLKREYKKICYWDLAFKSIFPLLFIAALLLAFKAIEAQVIKLFGVFCMCLVSFVAGIVFKVLEISAVRLEHEEVSK